jgi:hypothetical protein
VIRDHAVINVHEEKRRCECEDIDEHRRERDFRIGARFFPQRTPKPVMFPGDSLALGSRNEALHPAEQDRMAAVSAGELGKRHGAHSLRQLRQYDVRFVWLALHKDTCAPILHEQDDRQRCGIEIRERDFQDAGGEAGTLGCAACQSWRQPALFQR